MNKARIEAFSDSVFAVAMTLLVFNIKLPSLPSSASDAELWAALLPIVPSIILYGMTFAVLSVAWINHHFLFHAFARVVDRWLNLINLAYLMFVVLVPFSANVIATYPLHQSAAIIYGLNLFVIVMLSTAMMAYVRRKKLLGDAVSTRLLNQARFRSGISLVCYFVGILFSLLFVPVSLFFFAFPVIFNIIPGSLDLAERVFRFDLGP